MSTMIPDNWDDEVPEIVPPPVEKTKKKSLLSTQYPDVQQHLPKLFKLMKAEKLSDQRKLLLEDHLEAVSSWKPKRVLAQETRHETNKKKDEEDYRVLVECWKLLLSNLNLAENSLIQDRERVKQILEKYVTCQTRTFKYVRSKERWF